MISVIRMDRCDDDVSIDKIAFLDENCKLKPMYDFVKIVAVDLAKGYDNSVVEMSDQFGLPHASVFVNNTIEHQIFAAKEEC